MAVVQIGMLVATLALLTYIAVLLSSSLAFEQLQHPLEQEVLADSAMRDEMIKTVNYVHGSDISRSSFTTLLNGITLADREFILLFDSTPYASRGHIALILPCNSEDEPLFQVLVGRAPDLARLPLAYIDEISSPPRSCVYHDEFGFGDPVTDVALQNISGEDILLRGPHSVVITTHESFLPETAGEKEIQHRELSQVQP
ncbi:MAG: hypothetical protein ACREAE_06065 [Nitrosopumilaceae archaeon]